MAGVYTCREGRRKTRKKNCCQIDLACRLNGQRYAIYLLIIIFGIPVDICYVICVSLFPLKSHSNKASTTFQLLAAKSLYWLTLDGDLQKRAANGSSDFSCHHRCGFCTWLGLYLVWICKIFDSNLNIQKIAMLKFEICFSELKLAKCSLNNKILEPWEANAVHRWICRKSFMCIKLCPQLLANNWHRKSQ